MGWTAIVLTCSNPNAVDVYQKELEIRQRNGRIDKSTECLVIEDPVIGIGSGGATLNALLVITEVLTSHAGHTVVTSDVLEDARVAILHVSRQYAFNATGRAMLSLPGTDVDDMDYSTVLDKMLNILSQLSDECPPGVWVCSTDQILSVPKTFKIDWKAERNTDVLAFSVLGDIASSQHHGVYLTDQQGYVTDILYRKPAEELSMYADDNGNVDTVVCTVYFSVKAASKLLSFHVVTPLNSCTYVGIDSGAEPIKVSLFFDILYAMCSSKPGITVTAPAEIYQTKWRILHQILNNLILKRVNIEGGRYDYLFNDGYSFNQALEQCNGKKDPMVLSSVVESTLPKMCKVINSYIEDGWTLREGCVVLGAHLRTPAKPVMIKGGIVFQHMRVLEGAEAIPVIFHVNDNLNGGTTPNNEGTVCGLPWAEFLRLTGCSVEDLWKDEDVNRKTLMNAKLYPETDLPEPESLVLWMQDAAQADADTITKWKTSTRLSLSEILSQVDAEAELTWRRQLYVHIAKQKIRDVLQGQLGCGLIDLYKKVCSESRESCEEILNTIDDVAMNSQSPGIAARALANIADMLGCMAGARGGLRSGPSANQSWQEAYNKLESGDISGGIEELALVRRRWMDRAAQLIRAARHYEGAAQILIRLAVMTARKFISLNKTGNMPAIGRWMVGETPARADIAGGWSDTPPISYEHGGAVTNVAILVDGKKPIGCKVRRIDELRIVLVLESGSDSTRLTLTELQHLSDYYQPQSPGALLKAAFCCAEIINLDSNESLSEQLSTRYGSGFELCTWSSLPHGSGLGTSSILAGVIMATLWRASGQMYNDQALIHAVLHLEQMLTTGGGWQDQVGGLLPGFKIGYSEAKLPLYVQYKTLKISDEMLKAFNDRLLLVYTGKTRLARNLLQTVVRNWYARDPGIVQTEDGLVDLAQRCATAFENGDLEDVALCWNEYWELKKKMATGCEPQSVTKMIKALKPYTMCACMAGAGGGGFLYLLTKEPDQRTVIEAELAKLELSEGYSVHDSSVCMEGLTFSDM